MKDKRVLNWKDLDKVLYEITMTNTSLDFKWKFETKICKDNPMYGWFVRVGFERPDTNTGEVGMGFGRWEFIPGNSTESAVVKTAWLLIELVVRHELMEAFRWKGKRIFNPHNSIYDLAEIQE